jgi:hypothetical protein
MTIDWTDKSGELRSDEDLLELKKYLTNALVSSRMTADPGLIVLIPTAIDLLEELEMLRRVIRAEAKPDYAR